MPTSGLLVIVVLLLFLAPISPSLAASHAPDAVIEGKSCRLATYKERALSKCDPMRALLTVKDGTALLISLPSPKGDTQEEYLLTRIEAQADLAGHILETAAQSIAVCRTAGACAVADRLIPPSVWKKCDAEMTVAQASYPFRYNGEITPLAPASLALVCRDETGFLVVLDEPLLPSFERRASSRRPKTEFVSFTVANFEG